MNQHTNLLAFGTFGMPNGFTQSFFLCSNKELAGSVKTFDLKTDAIKLYPGSKVYAIRKEHLNAHNAIAYSIYTFAKEPNSDRGGTFIGSSILFINKIAEENITVNQLINFHNNLISKNVDNDVIKVTHSQDFSVSNLKDFNRIESQLKEVDDLNFVHVSNRMLVVYSEVTITQEKLQQLFQKAIPLLNVYDTVYFTDSKEVATFVHQKGIFKLATKEEVFEQEIENFKEERKQRIKTLIAALEDEKQKLAVDKKRWNEDYKKQIDQNKKTHQENSKRIEKSENELIQINSRYDGYARKIDESINGLTVSKKPDVIWQLHSESKRSFIDSVTQQTLPNAIHIISKPTAVTELRSSSQPIPSKSFEHHSSNHEHQHKKKNKLDIFKVAAFVSFLLWIGTLVYFLVISTAKSNIEQLQPAGNQLSVVGPPKAEPDSIKDLNPNPNAELSENDYKLVARKIGKNMPITEIVEVIFNLNPTDIKSIYTTQAKEYANAIFDLNKDCFKKDSSRILFCKGYFKAYTDL